MNVAICIPVHGWTAALSRTLEALATDPDIRVRDAMIVLTNSGPELQEEVLAVAALEYRIEVLPVPASYYWVAAVAEIYRYCERSRFDRIILMNHDCTPESGCLTALLDFCDTHPAAVAHAVLAYADRPDYLWWAGSRHRFGRPFVWTYAEETRAALPAEPFLSDSMMGQCMVIPIAAARPEYLHPESLIHYFGDSVQACEMKREGHPLYIVPSAVALTDQSDQEVKQSRICPTKFSGVVRSWFSPSSPRNLKATFMSSFWHQDTWIGGLLLGCQMVGGRVTKTIAEYLRVRRPFA